MKISLIHPSRSRPEKAKSTYDYWMSRAAHPENIEHILSLDFSDPLHSQYAHFGNNSSSVIDHNDCVVKATNIAASASTGDILIYLSDDFICPEKWDEKIMIRFRVADEDTPLLIKVDDCLQKFNVDVLTIPIMNRALYERLGFFWHPEYRSMFCDQWLYWVCRNNKWIMFCEDLKFPHEHYSIGKAPKDVTYIRSDANWVSGQALYLKHKKEGFLI